jgi:uncharacterized protein
MRIHHSVALAIVLLCGTARLRAEFPKADGLVTDAARVLVGNDKPLLYERLREVERASTAEIAVVTVASLDGMSIEDYANRLFKEWGIGKRGHDNGVLILVAPGERKIRIEVGYGLEAVLPDGLAGAIIREEALPAFRFRNYSGGILATARRVAAVVAANQALSAEEIARWNGRRGSAFDVLRWGMPLAAAILYGTFQLLSGIRRREPPRLLRGAGATAIAGVAWLMMTDLNVPFILLGSAGLAGLLLGFIGPRPNREAAVSHDQPPGKERVPTDQLWAEFNAAHGYDTTPEEVERQARSPEPRWRSSGSSGSSRPSTPSGDRFGGGRSGGGGASGSW